MQVQPVPQLSNADLAPPISGAQDEVIARIGYMTRILHDSLRGLGLDKALEEVTQEIPDARDRLNYVVHMTEQAAQRVLNATDVALPLQTSIDTDAQALKAEWQKMLGTPSMKSEYDQLAGKTIAFLDEASSNANQSKELLMDIMMAQDFQDLTGQVIKRVTELAQDLETQLIQVLIDFNPSAKKESDSLMNGPQIAPEKNPEAITGQAQVDDLLDSLGF
ncbi:Protein phosphatase CheZ [Methylophilaceae bacterium]|nr:Protein phosphatase CheZ [Methylophilaceae bacterium]